MDAALQIGIALLAGLLIGSFLNVCVFRVPRDISIASPARSFCPGCERTIAWYDNIPLLSFVALKGRCRGCGEQIPWRYPLVELATGVAFAVSVAGFGLTLEALKYCVFSAIMIDLIATDFEVRILPDEFTYGGMAAGLLFAYFVPLKIDVSGLLFYRMLEPEWLSVVEAAIAGAVASGSIWLVGWAYEKTRHRAGLGLGDVKMIALIGTFLGLEYVLLTLIVAAFLGSVVGIAVIVYHAIRRARAIDRRYRDAGGSSDGSGWRPALALFGRVFQREASTNLLPFGSALGIVALGIAAFTNGFGNWISGVAG